VDLGDIDGDRGGAEERSLFFSLLAFIKVSLLGNDIQLKITS